MNKNLSSFCNLSVAMLATVLPMTAGAYSYSDYATQGGEHWCEVFGGASVSVWPGEVVSSYLSGSLMGGNTVGGNSDGPVGGSSGGYLYSSANSDVWTMYPYAYYDWNFSYYPAYNHHYSSGYVNIDMYYCYNGS